jgi:toxin FitB
MADGKARGQPRNALDTLLGAIAVANNCVVVTDNEKDFAGINTINPLCYPDGS